MKYLVDVRDEVKNEDIPALEDPEVKRAAAEIIRQLYLDPRIGDVMRERFNLRALKGARKVAFDKKGWKAKPRFRFVFRNEPDDGAVARTTVLAIGPREKLVAYRKAITRQTRMRTQTGE